MSTLLLAFEVWLHRLAALGASQPNIAVRCMNPHGNQQSLQCVGQLNVD
ncbi:MAG: hypothetical protein P4L10_16440 [Acidobacteriaceae bacterium]|nr:hypothetical protein [Acidobacteriaceae bacterium]